MLASESLRPNAWALTAPVARITEPALPSTTDTFGVPLLVLLELLMLRRPAPMLSIVAMAVS